MKNDSFQARSVLKVGNQEFFIFRLTRLAELWGIELSRLPFSIRVLLEAALRQCNENEISQKDVENIARWTPETETQCR